MRPNDDRIAPCDVNLGHSYYALVDLHCHGMVPESGWALMRKKRYKMIIIIVQPLYILILILILTSALMPTSFLIMT